MEIVIDTETAGFYSGWDELLQVSVIDGEGYVLFDRLIKPSRRKKWPYAQRVHGIRGLSQKSPKKQTADSGKSLSFVVYLSV